MGRKKKKKEFVMTPYKDLKVYKKSKIPFHVNYTMRLSFVLVTVVFIGLVLGMFTNQISKLHKESRFKITENGYTTYNVLLKDNNYYTNDNLGMNMEYVPELIDRIKLRFNYNFFSEEYLTVKFKDTIKYEYVAIDNNDNKVIYTSTYYEFRNHELNRDKNINYYEEFDIDYSIYKDKYDELVKSYGQNISSYLLISNTIKKNSEMEVLTDYIKNSSVYNIKIPITNRIFSIDMNDDSKIRNVDEIIKEDVVNDTNSLIIITTLFLCLFFTIVLVIFIRFLSLLRVKRNKYDKYISKLLREYDSVIVETMVFPKTDGLNKITVDSFKEILDVRDLINKPIMYYNVVNHMKCIFYILDNNNLYVYTVKEVDLEK